MEQTRADQARTNDSEPAQVTGLDLAVLGLPKTGTTWLGRLMKDGGAATVFDESEKIETLWARAAPPSVLIAESVTDPLFVGGTAERRLALRAMGQRVRADQLLLVLREPVDWICSLYRQYVKRGGTRRFADFIGPDETRIVDPAFADFSRVVEDVRDAMDAPLAVSSYNRLKQDPRGFLGDIAATLGPDRLPQGQMHEVDEALIRGKANVGLRGVSGRIVRAANRVRRTGKWNPNGLVKWRGLERLPWHLLAGIGRDIISESDLERLDHLIRPYNDWPEWEDALQRHRVLHV